MSSAAPADRFDLPSAATRQAERAAQDLAELGARLRELVGA